jgi:hypothetical protein
MPGVKSKPGAPPANQTCPERSRRDARKHGSPRLYTGALIHEILSPEQKQALEVASLPGIDAEIALLRMQIRSIVQNGPKNQEPLQRVMSALCSAFRLRHNLASSRCRELIALSRLESGGKQLEANKPITKLIDVLKNGPAKSQNDSLM